MNNLNLQQSQMQKLRARSQVRLYDKDLLPSLKANSTSFMGRTIIPLSKFDLDSNIVLKEQRKLKMMSKIQNSQTNSKPKPKSKKNLIQSFLPLQNGYKLSTSDSKRDITYENFDDPLQRYPSKNLVTIQISKTSTKSYGFIKGYAANSHPGLYNQTNQDRICIVTNLNKTNVKPKQVSFFSIYDGSNGLLRADYYRDNFHLILNSQEQLLTDPQTAIKNTIQKIQKNLLSQMMYNDDISRVGYSIMISVGDYGYIVVCGNCRAVISKKFGQEIQKINFVNHLKQVSKSDYAKKILMKKNDTLNIFVKRFDLDSSLDFILLGSEGLYQNMIEEEISKKLWSQIIKSKHQSIHNCLGEATYNLLWSVFGLPSTKNASLIMLGFQNIQSCLKKNQKLDLPYLEQ